MSGLNLHRATLAQGSRSRQRRETGECIAQPIPRLQGSAGSERFEIRRRLGQGVLGRVYEVFDRDRNSTVALKTLRRTDADSLLQLKNEFRSLRNIAHPNLVSFHELFVEPERSYFTMELIDGVDFLKYLRPSGAELSAKALSVVYAKSSPVGGVVDETRLRDALRQLAEGLRALHQAGKVHRDIKPGNVLVDRAGRVVVLDFGLSIAISDIDGGWQPELGGTPHYMAPEQAQTGAVRAEADCYAVGVLLFLALTGRLPFEGRSLHVIYQKLNKQAPSPSSVVQNVAPDLDRLCVELLNVDPRLRPSAQEILDRLGADSSAAHRPARQRCFVGRNSELATLEHALANTTRDVATAICVYGESGVGKTALIEQFAKRASVARDALVLRGRCCQRESVPHQAFDGIVDALSEELLQLSTDEVTRMLPARAHLLPEMFPVLRRVPAVAALARDARPVPTDRSRRRQFTFHAMRKLLTGLAKRKTLVLIIDDVQWADAESMGLLASIMRQPKAPPLLLVLGLRDEPGSSHKRSMIARATSHTVQWLNLPGLPDDQALVLARELFLQSGQAASEEHACQHDARRRPHVRLTDALAARVRSLDAKALRLLRLACVSSVPVPWKTLCAASQQDVGNFTHALATLRVARFVRSHGGLPSRTVEPYHDRVRQAVLSVLDEKERASLNGRLAAVLAEALPAATEARPGTATNTSSAVNS